MNEQHIELFKEALPPEKVREQSAFFREEGITPHLFDLLQEAVIVTNLHRQIIYANRAALKFTATDQADDLIGMRPGEAFQCIHSGDGGACCGSTKYCPTCGSMFSLVSGKSGFHDFSLSRRAGNQTESLDLKIFACPVEVKGERFFFFTITDISHEKRVASLERIFYHDILNTAGGLRELASLIRNEQIEQDKEMLDMFYLYSDYLVQEIEAQKILKAAERNDLQAVPRQISSFQVLNDIVRLYLHHPVAKEKKLEIVPSSEEITFTSDKNLLARVIGNMIKNALEASKPGDTVTAGCRDSGEQIEFWVRNPTVMPEKVQLQVFQRSFSTKGAGRGLGTYGMRLLSERYLNGCVNFSSDESGTVFRAVYPKKLAISKPETENYDQICD